MIAVERRDARGQLAYHGLTAEQHQQRFEEWTSRGFVPDNVAVTSVDGVLRFAAIYVKRNVGTFAARSVMTAEQYQRFAEDQLAARRGLAYLRVFAHDGGLRYTAIFHRRQNPGRQVFRHGLTEAQYLAEFDQHVRRGFAPRMVSGADAGSGLRIAAAWQKTFSLARPDDKPVIGLGEPANAR